MGSREAGDGSAATGRNLPGDHPVVARLCGFDHYDGIPENHECEWLRGKSTVKFAVPRASSAGQPVWRIADEYIIVPIPEGMTAESVVLELAGQLCLEASA